MSPYNIVLSANESTVVTEYEPQTRRSDAYQSEAALEAAFIEMLQGQGYDYVTIHDTQALIVNANEGIVEKTGRFRRIMFKI